MADEALIERLKAMAHPLRFAILQVLRDGELNVGEIEEAAGIGQPALSQQLGVLRKVGLVETRKEAKLVYYRHSRDGMGGVLKAMTELTEETGAAPASPRTPAPGVANFARLP